MRSNEYINAAWLRDKQFFCENKDLWTVESGLQLLMENRNRFLIFHQKTMSLEVAQQMEETLKLMNFNVKMMPGQDTISFFLGAV